MPNRFDRSQISTVHGIRNSQHQSIIWAPIAGSELLQCYMTRIWDMTYVSLWRQKKVENFDVPLEITEPRISLGNFFYISCSSADIGQHRVTSLDHIFWLLNVMFSLLQNNGSLCEMIFLRVRGNFIGDLNFLKQLAFHIKHQWISFLHKFDIILHRLEQQVEWFEHSN